MTAVPPPRFAGPMGGLLRQSEAAALTWADISPADSPDAEPGSGAVSRLPARPRLGETDSRRSAGRARVREASPWTAAVGGRPR